MTKHGALAVAFLLATAGGADGQVGIAGRAGTLGFGGEVAIGLGNVVVLRGGAGLSTLEPNTTFDGIAVVLDLPDLWYNVGLDFYLNGAFRLGGGILFKPDDPVLRGSFDRAVDIGGTSLTPTELGALTGTVGLKDRAAYALIGFGKHTDRGVGLFVDLGAAFFGTPGVTLEAQGGSYPQDDLAPLLDAEARNFEEDMKTYLKVWPLLSVGLRVGFGG